MAHYAIVRSGGKQYRVEEGKTIDVARLRAQEGERVEITDVLLLADGDSVQVGAPNVPDATVVAEVVSHGRGKKITVFRYKAKTRYRRKTGHRQGYTRLAIQSIQLAGAKPPAEKPARRRTATAAAAEGEPAAKATRTRRPAGESTAEKPKRAPARRTRAKSEPESGE